MNKFFILLKNKKKPFKGMTLKGFFVTIYPILRRQV